MCTIIKRINKINHTILIIFAILVIPLVTYSNVQNSDKKTADRAAIIELLVAAGAKPIKVKEKELTVKRTSKAPKIKATTRSKDKKIQSPANIIASEKSIVLQDHHTATTKARVIPYGREKLITLLQTERVNEIYDSKDEQIRGIIIGLMAEQGFIPVEEVEKIKRDAEHRISLCKKDAEQKILKCKEETKTWHNIAQKRRGDLETIKEQMEKNRNVEEKKRDAQIDKKIGRLIGEILK